MMKLNLPHEVAIHIPAGFSDGSITYTTVSARAIAASHNRYSCRNGEAVANETVFIIQSGESLRPGCKITYRGETFELRTIKVCSDIDGNTIAYRCTV